MPAPRHAAFTVALGFFVAAAVAQQAQQTQPPQTPPAVPGSPQTVPEKRSPGDAQPDSPDLTKKLDQSEGVIKPPANVDPTMAKPAPTQDSHTMPVIKPPEDRGGAVAK